MKNGYKVFWTENALIELEVTILYLQSNWTTIEIRNLFESLDKTITLLSRNPLIFTVSHNKKMVRRVIILSFNTLYYRVVGDKVEILSFFSNRQNPNKLNV
jgi:plasmid stabilization system protein ParE